LVAEIAERDHDRARLGFRSRSRVQKKARLSVIDSQRNGWSTTHRLQRICNGGLPWGAVAFRDLQKCTGKHTTAFQGTRKNKAKSLRKPVLYPAELRAHNDAKS
jgi:hypothetical protein